MVDFTLRTPEDLPIPGQTAASDQTPAPAAPPPEAPLDENMQRRVDYAKWLTENKANAGTPEFVKVADAYRQLSDAAEKPQGNSEVFNAATRFATRSGLSPISYADLGVAMTNANLNPLNWPADLVRTGLEKAGVVAPTQFKPIPEPGAAIRSALNVPEQANTPLQRGAEFVGEAVSGGLPGIARSVARAAPNAVAKLGAVGAGMVRNVIAPTVGAQLAGEVGGQMFGERGRLIGAIAGGAGGQRLASVPGEAASAVAGRYDPRRYAREDAPQIAQMGVNQKVPTTFGSMANPEGVAMERQLMPNSAKIQQQSQDMLTAMQDRGKQLVQQRQELPAPTRGNAEVVNLAEQARVGGGDASGRVQQYIQDKVGQNAVITKPTEDALLALRNKMDPNDWNATVRPRLEAIMQMNPVDPSTGARLPYARYEQFKNWRSNLGKDLIDMPGLQSKYTGEVYDPATSAMRETAVRAGVHPEAFDTAQEITRSQEAADRLSELMRTTLHKEKAKNAASFADKIDNLVAKDPGELEKLGGNNVDALKELSILARRYDYATVKGGGAKTLAGQTNRFGPAGIAYGLTHLLTGSPTLALGAGVTAAKVLPSLEGRLYESNWARKRIAQGPSPPGPQAPTGANSFDRVLSALSAANLGSQ